MNTEPNVEGLHILRTHRDVANALERLQAIAVARGLTVLPLRVLAWSDAAGHTFLAHNDPQYLQSRHGFAPPLVKNIAGLAAMVAQVAQEDS